MPLTLSPSLPERLKAETAVLHREAEDLMTPLLQQIAEKEDYAAVLRIFYGFFYPLQQRVLQHIPTTLLPDIEERRQASRTVWDLSFTSPSPTSGLWYSFQVSLNSATSAGPAPCGSPGKRREK